MAEVTHLFVAQMLVITSAISASIFDDRPCGRKYISSWEPCFDRLFFVCACQSEEHSGHLLVEIS
jgi:hypothetical protein